MELFRWNRQRGSVSTRDVGTYLDFDTWGRILLSGSHLYEVDGEGQRRHGTYILGLDFYLWRRMPLPRNRLYEVFGEVQHRNGPRCQKGLRKYPPLTSRIRGRPHLKLVNLGATSLEVSSLVWPLVNVLDPHSWKPKTILVWDITEVSS